MDTDCTTKIQERGKGGGKGSRQGGGSGRPQTVDPEYVSRSENWTKGKELSANYETWKRLFCKRGEGVWCCVKEAAKKKDFGGG